MSRPRSLVVRGPFRGTSGYDHHVREFVRAFARRGMRQQLLDIPEWGPTRLPESSRDPWFETLGKPVPAAAVVHFCMPHQVRVQPGRLNVNYTMFEASRIPAAWAEHNRRHDLVLLPTESSRNAWLAAGFPDERIRLCPLGVDAERFRPDAVPLDLTDRRGRRVAEYRIRVLNVSEPGPRKNLAALLRVWIEATTPKDDAILVMKLGRVSTSRTVGLMRDLALAERAIGKSQRESAPIVFVDRILADGELPSVFAAATHYWSMSHGEGWDQPMAEAAATGLGLLAPAHSAYPMYLDQSVARMIPSRAVPAVVEGDAGLARLFAGATWWEPDALEAAAALREAIDGGGRRVSARDRMVAGFTWDRAAARLIEVLDELSPRRGVLDEPHLRRRRAR